MSETAAPTRKTPSLTQQKLVLWLAFLIISFVSLLTFYTIQRLIAASARVEQSQAILIETNRYLSDVKDVENGGRGYYLTGDGRYLRTQQAGIANAAATEARIRSLPATGELERRFQRLFALAEDRLRYSRELVSQRNSPSVARRSIVLATNVMDRLTREAGAIVDGETTNYRRERERREREAWLTSITLAVSIALCLAIIAWLFSIRGSEVQRRRDLERELRALNLELEDRVQERTAEVERTRELLDAVVENLPDMVVLKEPSGDGFRYVLINAAGERLLERSKSEIIGKTERDLFPPEEAAGVVQSNRAVLEAGQARTFTDRKLTTPTGVKTVETRMVPILNGNGSLILLLAIVRDVTDAKSREDQLRQLQRMDAIGRLTGGVAHDFNNLLAIIHGNSELVRSRLEDGSETAEMIDDVIGAAFRGAELVKRLLAFARMQHLEPESVDLNARLTIILGLLHRALGENVQLRVETAKALWPATIDPTQVDDALVNLAINARDAMPHGGTVTIETQNVHLDEDYAAHHVEVTPGDYVMLAVSDTGTGMAPEVIARAFEPFFTTKEEGQGTGLGLSQVFGWVKQSGGHIKIYSEVDHGTTLKLYLPRAEREGEQKATETEVATPQGHETILVVEDNLNVRKTVIRQLHDLGYKTVEAESGTHAMQIVENGTEFDLLLTDVIMPGGITGYQLADQLRAKQPELKVLFTSGYTELARAGDQPERKDLLLSKPYRRQDLGRAIRASLEGDRSEEAGQEP